MAFVDTPKRTRKRNRTYRVVRLQKSHAGLVHYDEWPADTLSAAKRLWRELCNAEAGVCTKTEHDGRKDARAEFMSADSPYTVIFVTSSKAGGL